MKRTMPKHLTATLLKEKGLKARKLIEDQQLEWPIIHQKPLSQKTLKTLKEKTTKPQFYVQ